MKSERLNFDDALRLPDPWGQHGTAHPKSPSTNGDPRVDLSNDDLAQASRNAFPVVARQKSRRDGLGLAAGALVAAGLGLVTFLSMNTSREAGRQAPARASQAPIQPAVQAKPFQPATLQAALPNSAPLAYDAPRQRSMPAYTVAPAASLRPGTTPVLVFDSGGFQDMGEAPAPARADGSPGNMFGQNGSGRSSNGADASALSTRLAEPGTTVVQGTLIPAVLETAIDSDVPGFARAVVTQDVRSFDGSRVLIPRSSRLIGEYKSGPGGGQRRVYLMWTRLVRPDGVSIALASPATDASGRAGVGGSVNTHFFEKLGSALLTTVLGAATPFGRGGSTVVISGGETAASNIVQGFGQRAPTVRVRQGEPVRVFAARDLVFTPTDGPSNE